MKYINECAICGKRLKNIGTHIKRIHNLNSKEYYDKYIKEKGEGFCKRCGKLTTFITSREGYSKYCSISCGAHEHKWNKTKERVKRIKVKCETCGKEIRRRESDLKYNHTFCSYRCMQTNKSWINAFTNSSFKWKSKFVYKNVSMRSSWEIEVAKVLDAVGDKWVYEPCRFKLPNGRVYVPDFLVLERDGGHYYIEVKGFAREYCKYKIRELNKYLFKESGLYLLKVFDSNCYEEYMKGGKFELKNAHEVYGW